MKGIGMNLIYKYLTAQNLQTAFLNTAVIFLFLFLFGLLIHVVKNGIHSLLAAMLGAKAAFIAVNYLTYPGTIHHELAHALLAIVTGARVTGIRLLPRGRTLGSVDMVPRGGVILQSVQNLLSAIAPVLCGCISLYCLFIYGWPLCTCWWQMALFFYLFFSVLLHMDLSAADIRIALSGLPVCAVIIFLILLVSGKTPGQQILHTIANYCHLL